MSYFDLSSALYSSTQQYLRDFINNPTPTRYWLFSEMFDVMQPGQTVASIACGSSNEDLYHISDKVGRTGRIILIDRDPEFIYNRAVKLLWQKKLKEGKDFYVGDKFGQNKLAAMFRNAGIEVYVANIPHYPQGIKPDSIDHIIGIDAAFDLMKPYRKAGSSVGEPVDFDGLVMETHENLKLHGTFAVQGKLKSDIEIFKGRLNETLKSQLAMKYKVRFKEDTGLPESLRDTWARWIKE